MAKCECADSGCPVHRGESRCAGKAVPNAFFRVDMDDRTGTRFCDACADDAMASGLFYEQGDTDDPDGPDFCADDA